MKRQFYRESRDLVYEGSILDIYKDHMVWENGHEEDWDFVAHRMGAACVVAVTKENKIVLVRQYRNALERETLELPAGCRNTPEEDMAIAAKRELEEETGYKAGYMEQLLSLKSTVAFCDEQIDVFLARELSEGTMDLDEGEDIAVELYDLEEVLSMIYAGKIQDAKTVSGILAYACRK